jgi:glutathione S-transferase
MSIFTTSKPTSTYFDLYGRGEAIRMCLVHSKTEFNDSRVSGQTWTDFKAPGKCNNGQLPVLEVGGQCLNQSESIIRFVGSQTGAYNTVDPFAMWAADAVINTCSDFEKSAPKSAEGKPLMYSMFGDAALSEENVASMVEHRGTMWAALQVLLGETAFFGGDKPSIADFWVAALLFSWERNTQGKEVQAHTCLCCVCEGTREQCYHHSLG